MADIQQALGALNEAGRFRFESYGYFSSFNPRIHLFVCHSCRHSHLQPWFGTPELDGEFLCNDCLTERVCDGMEEA